jgi:hypothetical protein
MRRKAAIVEQGNLIIGMNYFLIKECVSISICAKRASRRKAHTASARSKQRSNVENILNMSHAVLLFQSTIIVREGAS